MEITQEQIIGHGAFADVFRAEDRVVKLFKRRPLDPLIKREQPNRNEDEISRAVFESEVEAYKILVQNAGLAKHAPAFHGKAIVERVSGPGGSDVSGDYLLDCAMLLDFIPGAFEKVGHHPDSDIAKILAAFRQAGVCYTIDSSFVRHDGLVILIDFATKDAQSELEDWYMGFGGKI